MAKPSTGRRERRRAQLEQRRVERRTRAEPRSALAPLAIAFLLSGAAGLMHEVVWARLLTLLFGATSLAVSTVLAAYMGGLALGSWWIGRRSERLADGRRTYAMLEIAIGVSACLVPMLLALAAPVYAALWRRLEWSFAVFSVLRFVLASAILIGPTVLMGATLPVLAEYCARRSGRRLAPPWLYTLNLVGAALGVVAAGFWLMPAFGVYGTIAAAAAVNIGVGIFVLALPPEPERAARAAPAAPAVPATVPVSRTPLQVAAFASGAIAMVTQVAWTRVLTLVVGSTTYAFSSVLLVHLTALGLGSAWAARRAASGRDVRADLALVHAVVAVAMLATLWAVNRLPYWYLSLDASWRPDTLGGVVAIQLAVLGVVLLPPVLAGGTVLPLALGAASPAGARGTGPAVGRVYAINTLGAILGALAGGFVLVPALGSQATLLAVCLAAGVLAVGFALVSPAPGWLRGVTVAALAVVVAGVWLRPSWNFLELHSGVFEPSRIKLGATLTEPGDRTLYHREGPTASVFVRERGTGRRSLVINARVNASDAPDDMATQVLLAQVPLLLAPGTGDVFVLGWGSGVTVGSALVWPETRVTAVELEPAVVEASAQFDHVNHRPRGNPRLRLYEDDARHILLASPATYDVIVSEPSHPWVSGVANLFTREFYQLAARRLRPDGVFAQWLQTYQISLASFRAILATFQSVFPEVYAFQTPEGNDMILVGTRQPLDLRLGELERRWAADATRAELARVEVKRPEELLAGLDLAPDGVRALAEGAPLNTDGNMLVEFAGPRGMIWGRAAAKSEIAAALARHAAPLETVLADGEILSSSRERLDALVAALVKTGRSAERYEAMRRELR